MSVIFYRKVVEPVDTWIVAADRFIAPDVTFTLKLPLTRVNDIPVIKIICLALAVIVLLLNVVRSIVLLIFCAGAIFSI